MPSDAASPSGRELMRRVWEASHDRYRAAWVSADTARTLDDSVASGVAGVVLAHLWSGLPRSDRLESPLIRAWYESIASRHGERSNEDEGFFSGLDGSLAVAEAAGLGAIASPTRSTKTRNDAPGDLMTGPPASALTRLLEGDDAALSDRDIRASGERSDAFEHPGVAHGRAGVLLATVRPDAPPRKVLGALFSERERCEGPPWSWCNGVLGIGAVACCLGIRLSSDRLVDQGRAWIREGVRPVEPAMTKVYDSSLCHGLIGALLVCACAELALGEQLQRTSTSDLSSAIAVQLQRDGWALTMPERVVDITFLTGLSGIAAALEFCAHPRPLPLNAFFPVRQRHERIRV